MENNTEDLIKFQNLGTINKNMVTIGNLDLYFSYKTIVGFRGGNGLKVCENLWSNTTAKLLGELEPNKDNRLLREEFLKELRLCLIEHNFLEAQEEVLKEL